MGKIRNNLYFRIIGQSFKILVMLIFIFNDYPFEIEKSIVNWPVSSCFLNQEVSLDKENNNIIIGFISEDENAFNYKNVIRISYDDGESFLGDFEMTFWTNYCYVGDPVVAVKNNIFFHSGVIYCRDDNNNLYGEIYFCSCSNNCHSKLNWNCKILDNDNWQFFKDKPWIYIYNNKIILVFTTDKFSGYPRIVGYSSSNNGNSFSNVFALNVPSTYAYISDDKFGNLFISYNDFSQSNKIGFGILKSSDGQSFTDLGAVHFNYSSTICPDFKRPTKISNYITCYNNKCAIAYLDDNCFLKVLTWQNNNFNYYSVYNQQSVLPIVASFNNHLYIIFQSITGNTISSCPFIGPIKEWATFWTHSSDWGQTWSSISRVSSTNYGFSENPSGHDYLGFVVDNGYLYTAWGNDFRNNEGAKIYFTKTQFSNLYEVKDENYKVYSIDGRFLGFYHKNKKLKSGIYILKSKSTNKVLVVK